MAEANALPVAYLVCNFTPPVGERPSLLTHHDVLTLFHEFGHGLHHMLTRVDYPSVAGINGVPWDAVELPSQFMENFAWRDEVLPLISAHVDSGEPLLVEMLKEAAGEPDLPGRYADGATARIRALRLPPARRVRPRLAAPQSPRRWPRFAARWPSCDHRNSTVFRTASSTSSRADTPRATTSYKWAEVLSADAFGAFEEHGVFDHATAHRFLQSILERGGGRDAMEAFVEFRGPQARDRAAAAADGAGGVRRVTSDQGQGVVKKRTSCSCGSTIRAEGASSLPLITNH